MYHSRSHPPAAPEGAYPEPQINYSQVDVKPSSSLASNNVHSLSGTSYAAGPDSGGTTAMGDGRVGWTPRPLSRPGTGVSNAPFKLEPSDSSFKPEPCDLPTADYLSNSGQPPRISQTPVQYQQQYVMPPVPAATMNSTSRRRVISIVRASLPPGNQGTTISIICDLNFPASPMNESDREGPNSVRVLFGNALVMADVHLSEDQSYTVTAKAPSLGTTAGRSSWSVPVWLEACQEPLGVIDRAGVGEFIYVDEASASTSKRPRTVFEPSAHSQLPHARPSSRRRSEADNANLQSMQVGPDAKFIYEFPSPEKLVRTTQLLPNMVPPRKARLEINGDLAAMKTDWSPDMCKAGRRLVRCQRQQRGATVYATFTSVEQKDWKQDMVIISCLYHEARKSYYFTSVDIIHVLERLMADEYGTEEKNRIRRNLESFKPTTLQKNEGPWREFYAHIMSYPNPKPRNIDKGLKVFPWDHLEPALKKIFGNYSASSKPSSVAALPYGSLPPGGGLAMAMPQQHQMVAYHTHASPADRLGYADDRNATMHRAAHTMSAHSHGSGGSGDDMGYVTRPLAGYHRGSHSAGLVSPVGNTGTPMLNNYASAGAPGGMPSASPAHHTAEQSFGGYVNMPPAVPSTPASSSSNANGHLGQGPVGLPATASAPPPPRSAYQQDQAPPSLYGVDGPIPTGPVPALAYPPAGGHYADAAQLPYAHISNTRRSAGTQDLRVAYDTPTSTQHGHQPHLYQ